MSKSHFPGANTTTQYWAGKFTGSSMNTNCACIHTTETTVWPGYGSGASAPHMTILPNIKTKTVSIRQHFPAGKSSRALVNLAGGVETNTLNVFQIELIGTCDSKYRVSRKEWGVAGVDYIYWPDAPDWLLEAIAPVFRWLDDEWADFKIVDATPRGWVRYPDSYGLRARQRMTFAEWRRAYGIFGHQHVPENTHGDPGNFPIDRLIAAATGTAPPVVVEPPVVVPPVVPPAPNPQVAVWDLPSTWAIGSTGDAVTKLGQRLVVWAKHLGLPAPYKVGPGPEFTETDRAAVAAFQRAQGWSGADADGFPGRQTFRRLAANPTPATVPAPKPTPPADDEHLVETITANLAAYDVHRGMDNRVDRAKTVIPEYLDRHSPTWWHLQELSADMIEHIDAALPAYWRVSAGGKGRESYYRRDAGITILEAVLLNVSHMLLKDTKEHLVIAWERNGRRGIDVNFHNENEGSTFQPLQLRDVMSSARKMADKHGIPRANILITGDANFKGAAAFARLQRWTEVIYAAAKKIDLGYVSTNGWLNRVVGGRRIDVDIVQRTAQVLEAEQHFAAVNGRPVTDHWFHRVIRRLQP